MLELTIPWVPFDGHNYPQKDGYYFVLVKTTKTVRGTDAVFEGYDLFTLEYVSAFNIEAMPWIRDREPDYIEFLTKKYSEGYFTSIESLRPLDPAMVIGYCPTSVRELTHDLYTISKGGHE